MRPLRYLWLLLPLAVVLDNVEPKGCQQEPRPSAVVFDGEAYATVWAAPDRRKTTVYVHRFFARDFRGGTASLSHTAARQIPHRVLRVPAVRATPEIAGGGDGFMVFVHRGDGALVAVPLDADGAAAGEPVEVSAAIDHLCVSPARTGGSYHAAYIAGDELVLATLAPSGEPIEQRRFGHRGATRCAMAGGDGRIAIIGQGGGRQAAIAGPGFAVGWSAGDGGPLRMARAPDGWAVLHQIDGGLRVDHIGDDGGGWAPGKPLPDSVDPGSVDLGRNDRGLFVSWLADRQAHMAFVARPDIHVRHRAQRDALGTRAVGAGDRCAMTWTSNGGSRVTVLQGTNCGP